MPNKRKSRRYRKYLRGNVDELMTLGTLAGRALIAQPFDETVEERTYASSLVASWTMAEFTQLTDAGPILVGVAHSDYSAAEIEEFIENTASWKEGDLVQQEVAKRKIRIVGTFRNPQAATGNMILNNGRPIKTKLGWVLTTGQTIDQWAFNMGTIALATTDPQVFTFGHVNLFPL